MRWEKKGLIYCPAGEDGWRNNSFLTPTPFLLNDDVIRVYGSFRDKDGVGRIGYVDVKANNPAKVISISEFPVLDIGDPGMFDDNGIILGDILNVDNEIYIYYIGFQLVKKAKFLAFTGLAISGDGGNTFHRYSKSPILDRTENALFFRAIHSVMKENNKFKIWYAVGSKWQWIDGVPYPSYDVRYMESDDGINFNDKIGIHCLTFSDNEYRLGRPRVRKIDNEYEMMFTFDTLQKEYRIGKAISKDGVSWKRDNKFEPIPLSVSGWDSEMACYPATIAAHQTTYAFYNGNGMGKTGFGYAELIEE